MPSSGWSGTRTGSSSATEDGEPLKPALFSRAFQKQAKRAGVPVIRLHDLRHTYATIALQHGVHPKVVQERLGHRSITVTLDTYSHVIPSLQESAAEMIGSVINPPLDDPVDVPDGGGDGRHEPTRDGPPRCVVSGSAGPRAPGGQRTRIGEYWP